jgi:homoprotocatechuate degradation regulator HpaR
MSSDLPTPAHIRHRNLPLLLLQARERVIARFRPILNEHGVTEQQWRIVRTLLERGPLEPRELVEVCQISSPSLAGVLARMDEAGWVLRSRVDGDQRRVRVSLTPQSVALAEAMAPQIEAAYAEIEARLGDVFTQRFYAVLDALIERLDTSDGLPPEAD